MARYIDAEQFRGKHEVAEVNGKLNSVILYADIVEAPTADVVPKSEVMRLVGEYYDRCDMCRTKYANAVAREIFEEIEKTIRGALVLIGFSYKHNPKEIQCKKECYEDFLGYIVELKKKYVEGEQNDRRI